MRLAQIIDEKDKRALVVTARGESRFVKGARTTYELAFQAIAAGEPIRKTIADRGVGKVVDLKAALKEGRVLNPIDHKDPAHLLVCGTGLTHLGSAEGRDKMHKNLADADTLTDSMRMFKMGLEGGKPKGAAPGVQPEWFYKGDGSTIAAPGGDLVSPSFALDGGEEPEIVGIYVISPEGAPFRVGFALGNEFRIRSPIWRRIISNMSCSAALATCMCISSAPRPCPSPTASRRRRATSSKSRPRPSACRCATG